MCIRNTQNITRNTQVDQERTSWWFLDFGSHKRPVDLLESLSYSTYYTAILLSRSTNQDPVALHFHCLQCIYHLNFSRLTKIIIHILSFTRSLFTTMINMNIAILGATGTTGRYIVDELLASEHAVVSCKLVNASTQDPSLTLNDYSMSPLL